MLDDGAGSITFPTTSPDTFMSVRSAQCESAHIHEENGRSMQDLPILVFSGKCQSSCTVLVCECRSHYRMSGPCATLMKSVSNILVRNMHSSLVEVILEGSGSALPVPPCTKEQILVLLLGCCPSMSLPCSPRVTAHLPISPKLDKSVRKDKERAIVFGHHQQKNSVWGFSCCCLSSHVHLHQSR